MNFDHLRSLDKDLRRYEAEIDSIDTEIFWATKAHEMKMRNLKKQKEELEGHILSTEEARQLEITAGVR